MRRQTRGAVRDPYAVNRDLGFNPLERVPPGGSWLDLCCGSGRALIEATAERSDAQLVGVDLVDYFEAWSN